MKVEVVNATLAHVRAIVREMRAEDRAEMLDLDLHPRHTVHALFRDSLISRAGLIDGDLAAVWGMQGSLAAPVGYPWLFTTDVVNRSPVAFFRVGRLELAAMLEFKPILSTNVAAKYHRSARTWGMFGFELGEPEPLGATGALYRQMTLVR